MISVNMTPDQFTEASAKLKALSDVQIVFTTPTSGSLMTKQLSADFNYDGTALALSNTKKFGLAKFASDATVQHHLELMLGAL